MSNVVTDPIFQKNPGMGLNANPFEAEITFDLTGPLGSLTGQYYSLMFQLGKNGFFVFKMDEFIDVSPVFKQYYDLTIQQKQALEGQIKAGLAQIATAIHDFELISHDMRKYKEYLDYFRNIEKGEKLLKSKLKEEIEEGEKLKKEGIQTLRSVFVDQVDAHTGEGIALRTITQRWPTIIVDFMRLDDKDTDYNKTADKLGISQAEASILATKNKLFLEWRDVLFKETLKQRYQNVVRLVESRKTSIKRYTDMLKPAVSRFKLINDALEGGFRNVGWRSFFQPGSQAYSMDVTRIWAFMPFAPAEKYKVTREFYDEISAKKAGFSKEEIENIKKQLKQRGGLNSYENSFVEKETVVELPAEPSIDKIIRDHRKKIEGYYGVKTTDVDIFDARQRLVNLFLRKSIETQGGDIANKLGLGQGNFASPGLSWVSSPYYIFLDIPFPRTVVKLPNGVELEDIMIENMTVKNRTQNVIIVTLWELMARERQLENYIGQLLGEVGGPVGGPELKSIEDIVKGEYPEIFEEKKEEDEGKKGKKKEKKKEEKKKDDKKEAGVVKKAGNFVGDFLKAFGLQSDWLRARGPYEFAMDDRIAEMFQMEVMIHGYLYVLRYLQRGAGVPGIEV